MALGEHRPEGGRMAVVPGTGALDRTLGRLFAVVGVFDGLHLGHEYLLRELRRVAGEHRARPAVITFDHHPDEVLKGAAPPLLCDPDERLERLAEAGVEVTVIETFDRALRETPYDTWVRRIAQNADLAGLLMTPESAFGYERRGTPETVAELGQVLGYAVVVVPQFTLGGASVSSSAIRGAIEAGDLRTAERLLGRPYAVVGEGHAVGVGHVAIEFALPVALPPGGPYDVTVQLPGSGARSNADARVDAAGVLTLSTVSFEGRARIVFAAG